MCYLDGNYSDQNQQDIAILQDYILSCSGPETFTGREEGVDGVMQNNSITLMHNRSVAEQILYKQDGQLFNGFIVVDNGKLNTENLNVEGNSLLIGADLTGKAFTQVYLVNTASTLLQVVYAIRFSAIVVILWRQGNCSFIWRRVGSLWGIYVGLYCGHN